MRDKECAPRRLDQHGNAPSKERRECGTSREEPRLRRFRLPCLLSLKVYGYDSGGELKSRIEPRAFGT
jgi:hypothetical protein